MTRDILITVSTHVQTCGVTGKPINAFNPNLEHRLPFSEFVRAFIADVFFQEIYVAVIINP